MTRISRKQTDKPVATAQKLGSVIKSARDIMRKDRGLNGELDRLPQLTWILFLKLLHDSENLRQAEAELDGIAYKPAIAPPYRWRDWAADDEGISGDKLRNFINNDEADLPDGTRGKGVAIFYFFFLSKYPLKPNPLPNPPPKMMSNFIIS